MNFPVPRKLRTDYYMSVLKHNPRLKLEYVILQN